MAAVDDAHAAVDSLWGGGIALKVRVVAFFDLVGLLQARLGQAHNLAAAAPFFERMDEVHYSFSEILAAATRLKDEVP